MKTVQIQRICVRSAWWTWDISLSPEAFGLRAFDSKKSLMRMLPGSSPCELQLMLPDSQLGTDGFHDVLVDNLSASPSWRSSHISPADVTALRRWWPKAVFKTIQRRAKEVEEVLVISQTGRFDTASRVLPHM